MRFERPEHVVGFLHRHRYMISVWLIASCIFLAAGIVSAFSSDPQKHQSFSTPPFSINDTSVFRLGQAKSLADILNQESQARVFLVGEKHTRVDHHQVQLEVLRFLHEKDINIALGVEWFQKPFQPVLDDFIAGNIDENEMLHKTGYFDRWRYDYRLYRPILQFAREHGIPVIALNASRELMRALSKNGFDNLPDELQAQLPRSYDWSDKDYEKRLSKFFDMHPDYPGSFEGFMRGQLTWDESMAESATDYLKAHPDSKMLILAGRGHIEFGSGIPNRIKRRLDTEVISILVNDSQDKIKPEMADYLVMSTEQFLPDTGLIGAFLKTDENRVEIISFSKNSASKDAGVTAGAIIVGVDDADVVTMADFKLAMLDKGKGDSITLHYLEKKTDKSSDAKSVEITLR